MKRGVAAILFILVMAYSAQAISADIKDVGESCDPEQEASLVSINDTDGGHVAEPGYYGHEVCVEGEIEYNVRESCTGGETHVFSLFDRTNSHLSMYSTYNYDVCSRQTRAWVDSTCSENGTAVLSVESDNNTHVAEPNHEDFSQQICMSFIEPENVTVELSGLSGDDFYVDDHEETVEPREESWRLLEYPYVVAEENNHVTGLVSQGDFVKLSHPDETVMSMTVSEGSILVPHTEGGVENIERRQDMVLDNVFLRQLSPSFAFFIPDQPTVRVVLQPDQEVEGFSSVLRRDITIGVSNEGLRDGELVINIEG